MNHHLRAQGRPFPPGYTPLVDVQGAFGLGLGVLRLAAGETLTLTTERETAWLMMHGAMQLRLNDTLLDWQRSSLFSQSPSACHVPAGTVLHAHASQDTEITTYETANTKRFEAQHRTPSDVPDEHRGRGQVGDTCYRLVRTLFDRSNTNPAADLVLGEVITLPGRWSSYPPHHHPQPEIYHYRFDAPQGFGFAQCGDDAQLVRDGDTLLIPGSKDHAQSAAPGYAMYYSWAIRHLPETPYVRPDFTPEHAWVMEPDAEHWAPTTPTSNAA